VSRITGFFQLYSLLPALLITWNACCSKVNTQDIPRRNPVLTPCKWNGCCESGELHSYRTAKRDPQEHRRQNLPVAGVSLIGTQMGVQYTPTGMEISITLFRGSS
jgi:hypothetical protein